MLCKPPHLWDFVTAALGTKDREMTWKRLIMVRRLEFETHSAVNTRRICRIGGRWWA